MNHWKEKTCILFGRLLFCKFPRKKIVGIRRDGKIEDKQKWWPSIIGEWRLPHPQIPAVAHLATMNSSNPFFIFRPKSFVFAPHGGYSLVDGRRGRRGGLC
jgi:hypothetical protein